MSYHRRKGGLNIKGVGSSRRMRSGARSGPKLFSQSQSRADRASQRAALARAARGRDTYIHPSNYGKRQGVISRRMVAAFIAVLAIGLVLSFVAGYFVYQQAAKNALKPAIDIESISSELVAPKDDETPFWTILVHTDASSAEAGRGDIVDLALVCIDPDNIALTFLWIPVDTRVYINIDGYRYTTVEEAFEKGAEAGVTDAVSKLAGIDISHYIEFNDAGLHKLENQLAPLSVDVNNASRDALTFAICKKLFGSSSEQITSMVETFMSCVATDASFDEVKKVFRAVHGINIETSCYAEEMPCTTQNIDGVLYSVCNTDTWSTMVARVASGMSPVASASEVDTNKVMRDQCTVAVWNGVGVSGVANDCATELKKLGWNVISTGNANQFIYDETFVIFKNTDDEAAARLLAADLGQGRVVRSYARYNYTGNLLVVVGKDYKPY